jgi:hypothetical protein
MMRLSIALAIVLLCAAMPAVAQQGAATTPTAGANTAVAPKPTTPVAAPAPAPITAPVAAPAPAPAAAPATLPRPDAPARHGRQNDTRFAPSNVAVSSGMIEPTPEMWLYEQQLREYLDPAMAVRRNAEFRAAQRQHRIAALKWFGFSNQRPSASPDPYNGEYSPAWVGNNGLYPYRWIGGSGYPWVALRPGIVAY